MFWRCVEIEQEEGGEGRRGRKGDESHIHAYRDAMACINFLPVHVSASVNMYAFLLQRINRFNILLTLFYHVMEEVSSFNSEEYLNKT